LRSWLTAILKNKIVDLVRQRAGIDSLEELDDEDGALRIACLQPGPDDVAEQRQLLAHMLARIDALPPALRDVMRLRVLQEQSTSHRLPATGDQPEDNLFVRLHRARRQLCATVTDSRDAAYSPLWRAVMVRWLSLAHRQELRSEEDILAAEDRAWISTELTSIVINCPIVAPA
jgi:DNA-directed RNA polymerase specialized sigma24 family protein